MSNYVPRIETSASDIDAINSQVGIDWYQLYKSQVDETSEVDIKYMNIYLLVLIGISCTNHKLMKHQR